MNTSLINPIKLCEDCYNNVNFVMRVKEVFLRKQKEFLCKASQESHVRQYCRFCFNSETPDIIFLRKDNYYPSNILKEMIDIALSECINFGVFDNNVCSSCWSWIKKIYEFKRQCFKMEENLKFYCSRKNWAVLKDRDIGDFLNEQYYIRTCTAFKCNDVRREQSENPKNSVVLQHQKYFEATGEVYSNLEKNSVEKVKDVIVFEENDEAIFKRKNDVIPIDVDIKVEPTTDISEYKSENILYNDEESQVIIDVDDEFDEESEKNRETDNTIIILDGDDDANNNDHFQKVSGQKRQKIGISNPNMHCLQKLDQNNDPKQKSTEHYGIIKHSNDRKEPTVIYTETPQFAELYNSYISNPIEPQCRLVANDNLSPVQIVTNIYNINVVSQEKEDIVSKGIQFNGAASNSFYSSRDKDEDINILNLKNDNSDGEDLLLMDDDCYEIIEERNNIIDLTNVDSYIKTLPNRQLRSGLQSFYDGELFWGCYVCDAIFDDKKSVRRHLLNHEDPWNKFGRFKCRFCQFKSNWKGSITRHEYVHSELNERKFAGKELTYMCPYCDAIYTVKEEMRSHMNEHVISWKHFQCVDCMFRTNSSEPLRSHYWNNHSKKKDPTFSGQAV